MADKKKRQTPVHHIHEFKGHQEASGGFYVNTLQEHLPGHDFIRHPHKHDFYVCVLFTSGTGTHTIDFRQYRVKPGAVFMMMPGQMHHWQLSADTKGYIFFHSAAFFNLYYRQLSVHDFPFYSSLYQEPVLYLGQQELQRLMPYLGDLYRTRTLSGAMTDEKRLALVTLVYLVLSEKYRPAKKVHVHDDKKLLERLHRFEALIDLHFRKEKSASFYAAEMGMSRKHLNRLTQEGLGKTVSEMIADRIVLESKRLLVNGDQTAVQVAESLGYDDPSYFTRFFRRHTGQTPMEFQREKP